MQTSSFGFSHFLAHTDGVGIALFLILMGMSVLSWTVIVAKARQARMRQKRARQFLTQAESSTDPLSALRAACEQMPNSALARIARHGLATPLAAPTDAQGAQALIHQALAQAVDDEASALESGQTALASTATTAPFVGLFGTVWGIYHALILMGQTGSGSLDQVAGPVGEALIMTALGLAVAIPAAVAYNVFQRQIRLQLAQLERFAHRVLMLSVAPTPVKA